MYVFKLKSLSGTNATAMLVSAQNPYINGRLTVANDYRGNTLLLVNTDYKLSLEAIRRVCVVGDLYAVAGSWISGTLHVTSMKKVIEMTIHAEEPAGV